jgi:hypothetical protein
VLNKAISVPIFGFPDYGINDNTVLRFGDKDLVVVAIVQQLRKQALGRLAEGGREG